MKRTDALYQSFVEILREELVPAMGCTEPIAIAYAAAQARAVLGKRPERVRIEVSGNIIKNVKSVVVPHTGSMHGIAAAAAAGIIAGREEKELEVLSEVTDEQIADMRAYLQEAAFDIRPIDSPFIFDIRITVYAAGDQASARIVGSHTNLVQLLHGTKRLIDRPCSETVSERRTDRGATTMGGYSDAQKLENAAGAAARAMGYSEIITYSFVSPASFDAIRVPADSPLRRTVKLINPLGEDTSIMRTVILPSMLDILSRNFAFKNKGVKLYEIGKIYLPKDGEKLPDEPKRMIFGTYGEHENFFTLKGEIDAILDQLNVHPATYIADTKNPSYHPGRCADIVIDGKKMGVIGQIHPLVAETYGIGGEVYVAELDFTGLQAVLAPERVFHSLPKFPTVSRDLALVCEESMTVGMLEACIKKAGGKLLRSVQLFDIYRGPGIAPGKKSIAFSLELRADDRTLTDEDTTGVMNAVLEKLKNDLGVSLR